MDIGSTFDELRFTLPQRNAAHYATLAIRILNDIQQTDSAIMAYLLDPSAVLTFAGLRAQSPYHSFADTVSAAQINTLDAILHNHNIYRQSEITQYEKHGFTSFSFWNYTAICEIPQRYKAMEKVWFNPEKKFSYGVDAEWIYATVFMLANLMEKGTLPKQWLKDWFAPHNLRFGMLLGYPGEAISSFLWQEANDKRLPKSEDIVISTGEPFYGTSVSFAIIKSTQSITDLVTLWKDTLQLVYSEFDHTILLKDEEYAQAHKTRGIYESKI